MTKVSTGEIQRTGGHRRVPQSQNQAEVLDFSDWGHGGLFSLYVCTDV